MRDAFLGLFETSENGRLLPSRIARAILHLKEAQQFSSGFAMELWQFAVKVQTLRNLGVTDNDCRWLFCSGAVHHGIEATLEGDQFRTFRRSEFATFSKRSCFVLTEEGTLLAEALTNDSDSNSNSISSVDQSEPIIPFWDDTHQELYVGDQLVKRYKLPAENQTAILRAFQEERWTSRIDDPLPPKTGRDSKRRLHDTINSLNRNQKHQLIRFYGDGTGQGICWKLNR